LGLKKEDETPSNVSSFVFLERILLSGLEKQWLTMKIDASNQSLRTKLGCYLAKLDEREAIKKNENGGTRKGVAKEVERRTLDVEVSRAD